MLEWETAWEILLLGLYIKAAKMLLDKVESGSPIGGCRVHASVSGTRASTSVDKKLP